MAIYNTIGRQYSAKRKPDRRLADLILSPIADLETILNVGAGAGSYEPKGKTLVALDPSWEMISQRPNNAAPCVCGVVESLPFLNNSFEGAMVLLTLHHWHDLDRGLKELKRVISKRLVIHTWDPAAAEQYWLINNYLPEICALDSQRFLPMEELRAKFSSTRVIEVPIPFDCSDGFMGAYWRRPEAYFDEKVKKGISSFQQIPQFALEKGLSKLRADLDSGHWRKHYADIMEKEELDLGYRLIVAEV